MSDLRPLGVFDSGIGGLTVVRELLRILPEEELVYYGDVARLPYGNKSKETVTRFSREITSFLVERGVKAIVVACNTASALALPDLAGEASVPVVGVIEPGARAAATIARAGRGKLGVIATASTVRSASLVPVLPTLPVMAAIFALERARAARPSPRSASSVSATSSTGPSGAAMRPACTSAAAAPPLNAAETY